MAVLITAGIVSIVVAWRLVESGRARIWPALGTAVGLAGLAAILSGRLVLSGEQAAEVSAVVGAASGIALFLLTRAFVRVVRPWHLFQRHATDIYGQRRGVPLPVALAIAVGLVATGEELFWRGLVQGRLAQGLGDVSGAAVAWLGYAGANAASGSLAVSVAAAVAGAVWAGLAVWSGGVLASLVCHWVWTGFMLILPPVPRPASLAAR